jgi:hypothetical protein
MAEVAKRALRIMHYAKRQSEMRNAKCWAPDTRLIARITMRQFKLTTVCLLVFCLGLFACAPKGEDCTVTVRVLSQESGSPLAGVQLSVDGKEVATSGADGVCRAQVKLSYGQHKLVCENKGYERSTWTMKLAPQEASTDAAVGEESLLDEIGELAPEFDFQVEMMKELD